MVVSHAFFDRSADMVARELLGCTLCMKKDGLTTRHTITETEAYMGPHDLACHVAKGRTKRTDIMFRKAGTIYVYLVYGMYDMLNIVTGSVDYPAAVLIRGAGTYDGPGKLTRALGITRAYNGGALSRNTGLWIEHAFTQPSVHRIRQTKRIGVSYAKDGQRFVFCA